MVARCALMHLRRAGPLLALALLGLAPRPAQAFKLVATTSDVGAIAREVVGPDGTVVVLANPNQDPHYVDPRPSLLVDMSRADALLVAGLDLEVGWLPSLLRNARNAAIQAGAPGYVDASAFILPLDVPALPVDRSMGDIHPRGNPHYLKDPRNAVLVARGLADRLGAVDGAHAAQFKQRAEAFAKELEVRIRDWEARTAPLKGQGVVTYHASLNYLLRWLGLAPVGAIESKPGVPPSPAHLAGLIVQSRSRQVKLFLAESWFPTATSSVVAQKAGGALVVLPGLPADNQRYADHIEEIVAQLEKAGRR